MLPVNLVSLHRSEEQLREKAIAIIAHDTRLQLNLTITECAMDIANTLRQFKTADENLKVVQMLGMRTFNAFGAALKLALSGYGQKSALVMRDILETVFLVDLFRGDRTLVERWRFADKKAHMKEFSPVKVREALDARDGFTSKNRAEMYQMFSELAGHPTMNSVLMMRPEKGGDAVIGPFIEKTSLEATLSEMGRLALQIGELLSAFFHPDWPPGLATRASFAPVKQEWLAAFYPNATTPPQRKG